MKLSEVKACPMKWLSGVLLVITTIAAGNAQEDVPSILSYSAYMDIVRVHHPVAIQAGLQLDIGDAAVLRSRGAFDPNALTDVAQKYFKGDQYYSIINGGLKIPTWFGVEVQGGYEINQGDFLNEERTVPQTGLWYAGISIPVGQGLFIDKRRAELQKAELFNQATEFERQLIINDLLFEAGNAYWGWYQAYAELLIFEEALSVAEQRFDIVKREAELGDSPLVDTLEAGIQVQNRQLALQEAQLNLANKTAQLSVYLWADGIIPLELEPGVIPELSDTGDYSWFNDFLSGNLDAVIASHPMLMQNRLKISQLEVERRLRKENLKPVANLKYNAIASASNGNLLDSYTINDYTWGLEFKMPIFLRKERGELRLADIEIQEAELGLDAKQAEIDYKVTASINDFQTTQQQIELYTRTVQDYSGLLEAERELFRAGESSLFLVNARELGYINAQVKLVELQVKNRKAALAADYALGALN